MSKIIPRGRLAPSPTGALHLGNARSFLIAWLSIRSQHGSLVLRIEDLDHPKVKPNAVDEALEDLKWLGLDWDEGPDKGGDCAPYTQSLRRNYYRDALNRLSKNVYPCVCSRKDVENAQSAPHIDEQVGMMAYSGTCRHRFENWNDAVKFLSGDRIPAWRFNMTKEMSATAFAFEDGFYGRHELDVYEKIGDFVLARDKDGAGYTLAVVVDDALMGITEVVRGDDLLDATHCQIALQKTLGFNTPAYYHVPLVVAEDGRRLAKRHGDTRIRSLRESGISGETIVGLLAYWCGWAHFGEKVSAQDLISRFDMKTLKHEQAVLTPDIKNFLSINT